MTAVNDLDDFGALDPFFRIIEEGLSGLVDGDNFFDVLADEVVFEYLITVPGYPRYVVGRSAVAELYRPYGDTFVLHRCFDLAVHHDRESGVVVLEYASEGRVVATGAPYANRYISVLKVGFGRLKSLCRRHRHDRARGPRCVASRKPVVVPDAQHCVVLERLGCKVTAEKAA